jgi:hypothetical protein
MKRNTHRTEIRIETHEIKIIRFGKRVDEQSDATETVLVNEHVSPDDGTCDAMVVSPDLVRRVTSED